MRIWTLLRALAAEKGLGPFIESQIEVERDWKRCRTRFEPSPRDFAKTAPLSLTGRDWFFKHILAHDRIYDPIAKTVKFFRRKGVFGG